MRGSNSVIRLGCLLLVLVFVGAQLHFCADFAPNGSGSHVCQLCATAGHAVAVQAVVAVFSLATTRLEAPSQNGDLAAVSFRLTSPRAPPSL